MSAHTTSFTLEFFGFNAFFLRAFGYEVFKEPGVKVIISKRP